MTIAKTDASNSSKALDEMYHLTAAQDPRLRASWVKDLPAVFASEGLKQVEAHTRKGSDHHSFAMHICNLLIYDTVTRQSSRSEAQRISSLVPEASKETRDGAMITFERITVTGRKP